MSEQPFDLTPYLVAEVSTVKAGSLYLELRNSWDREKVLIGPLLEFSLSSGLLWLRFETEQHLFMRDQDELYVHFPEMIFCFRGVNYDNWRILSDL